MGNWLDYFRNRQANGVQGNLLGPPETSDIVIDHTSPSQKLAYTRLQDLVKARGGSRMAQSFLEPYQILGFMLSPTYMRSPIREHYGQQIIEAMLQFPEVIAILKDGLEQVYRHAEHREERALVEQFIQDGNQFPQQILQAVAA